MLALPLASCVTLNELLLCPEKDPSAHGAIDSSEPQGCFSWGRKTCRGGSKVPYFCCGLKQISLQRCLDKGQWPQAITLAVS